MTKLGFDQLILFHRAPSVFIAVERRTLRMTLCRFNQLTLSQHGLEHGTHSGGRVDGRMDGRRPNIGSSGQGSGRSCKLR